MLDSYESSLNKVGATLNVGANAIEKQKCVYRHLLCLKTNCINISACGKRRENGFLHAEVVMLSFPASLMFEV